MSHSANRGDGTRPHRLIIAERAHCDERAIKRILAGRAQPATRVLVRRACLELRRRTGPDSNAALLAYIDRVLVAVAALEARS